MNRLQLCFSVHPRVIVHPSTLIHLPVRHMILVVDTIDRTPLAASFCIRRRNRVIISLHQARTARAHMCLYSRDV
jgi:hypothetical protein